MDSKKLTCRKQNSQGNKSRILDVFSECEVAYANQFISLNALNYQMQKNGQLVLPPVGKEFAFVVSRTNGRPVYFAASSEQERFLLLLQIKLKRDLGQSGWKLSKPI